jgi:hypothetical protein
MSRRVTALVVAVAATAVTPAGATAPRARAALPAVTLDRGQWIYRGTGARSLGVLRLRRTAKLTWRHPGGGELRLLTSVSGGGQFPLVTTAARSGSVRLRAGTYRGLRVQAAGGWRITAAIPKRT